MEYKDKCIEMLDEWHVLENDIHPWSIGRIDCHDFDVYLKGFIEEEQGKLYGGVPATTYFAYDDDTGIIVGAVNIRHWLNEKLFDNGGHIGDGIRPSQRRKGYATKMIALALIECRKMGLDRVLMVCHKDNIGSRKSIMNNGGILENEVISKKGILEQRFWIDL
jgi:predicted acetyltransferase